MITQDNNNTNVIAPSDEDKSTRGYPHKGEGEMRGIPRQEVSVRNFSYQSHRFKYHPINVI